MATAIVTGSGRGIGAEIALRLAAVGFNLVINDISEEACIETRDKARALGVEAEAYAADVSNFAACEELIKKVKDRFGTVDVLVNNAGITRDGLMVRMSEDQYDLVIAVNQKSVFNMMRHAGAVMMKQKSGRIINIASLSGLHGIPGQVNYSASKGAIVAMTKTASKELGSRGITVNAVAPGFIETDMTAGLSDDIREKMLSKIPLGYFGTASDIAETVAFLCSDGARYITGQVFSVNGGMYM